MSNDISQLYEFETFFYTFTKIKLETVRMKKTILFIALALTIISCDKKTEVSSEEKTAYIDTSKLLDEYTQAKDIEAKYKAKSEQMGKELDLEIKNFQSDAANFQRNAQANGQAWAQQNGAALQKREQELTYKQQAMMQQLQRESGAEMDTLVKSVKLYIKEYGKQKGYGYIYGTGESATILYAKDKYDITEEVVTAINEKFKKDGRLVAPEALKTDDKKEEKK